MLDKFPRYTVIFAPNSVILDIIQNLRSCSSEF